MVQQEIIRKYVASQDLKTWRPWQDKKKC